MECIQNEKSLNTGINKLNWRFNYMFSDHKPGLLLYAPGSNITANMEIVNECQREIDNISSVYNTDKICQDLQFLSIYYINHAKTPGRYINIPNVLQEMYCGYPPSLRCVRK